MDEDRELRLLTLLYEAWTIIANAGPPGDWGANGSEWREAAVKWRDKWHEEQDRV